MARFLVASQRRAADVRGRRPELRRQSRVWLVAGAGAWVLPAVAGVEPFRGQARGGLAWWCLTALMLDWHLGMMETEDGRPRPLGAADALTLVRVWLTPVAWAEPTPFVCAAGFATDVLDGPVARAGEATRAGRDLEGLADACFATALLAGLRRRGALGPAASAAELVRLGAGVAGSLTYYFSRAEAPDRALVQAARNHARARAGTSGGVGGAPAARHGARRRRVRGQRRAGGPGVQSPGLTAMSITIRSRIDISNVFTAP